MKINKTKYSIRTIIKWLYSHSKGCRLQASINALIGIAFVVLGLIGVDNYRIITDIATNKREGDIILTALVFVGIFLAELLLHIAQTWVGAVLGVKTQNITQQYFFARLLRGQWNGVEKYHSGDVINRLFGDVGDIVHLMTEVIPTFLTVIIQFVASIIYLFHLDQQLAIILIIVSPVFLLLSRIYFNKMRRIVRHIKDSNSAIQAIIQECVQHKMVIKVLGRENSMVDKLEKRQAVLRRQTKSRARFSIIAKSFVSIGFSGTYIVAFVWGLLQVQQGIITMGVLMAFSMLIHRIQRPLLDILRLLPVFVNSMTSTERLIELESLPLENIVTSADDTASQVGELGISFKNVTYRYSEKGHNVLTNFSHTFQPRSFTAILGETGAGKTTLIRMMLALINPQEGEVQLIDNKGNAIQSGNDRVKERKHFAYIPQGNTLFSGSIRENLLMGNPNATTEQMRTALHIAMADFVFDLPDGIYTKCSEHGGGVSEGQAQRIAIARAILRPCKILLLDEATSALDVQTEKKLLENLKQHFQDTTIIFVTHRLAVVDFTTDVITMERK